MMAFFRNIKLLTFICLLILMALCYLLGRRWDQRPVLHPNFPPQARRWLVLCPERYFPSCLRIVKEPWSLSSSSRQHQLSINLPLVPLLSPLPTKEHCKTDLTTAIRMFFFSFSRGHFSFFATKTRKAPFSSSPRQFFARQYYFEQKKTN